MRVGSQLWMMVWVAGLVVMLAACGPPGETREAPPSARAAPPVAGAVLAAAVPFDPLESDRLNGGPDCYFPSCAGVDPEHHPALTPDDGPMYLHYREDGRVVRTETYLVRGKDLVDADGETVGDYRFANGCHVLRFNAEGKFLAFRRR